MGKGNILESPKNAAPYKLQLLSTLVWEQFTEFGKSVFSWKASKVIFERAHSDSVKSKSKAISQTTQYIFRMLRESPTGEPQCQVKT